MSSSGKTSKIIVVITLLIVISFIFLDIFNGQFSFSNNEKIENLIVEKENNPSKRRRFSKKKVKK